MKSFGTAVSATINYQNFKAFFSASLEYSLHIPLQLLPLSQTFVIMFFSTRNFDLLSPCICTHYCNNQEPVNVKFATTDCPKFDCLVKPSYITYAVKPPPQFVYYIIQFLYQYLAPLALSTQCVYLLQLLPQLVHSVLRKCLLRRLERNLIHQFSTVSNSFSG